MSLNFTHTFLKPADSSCERPDVTADNESTNFVFNPHRSLSLGQQRDKLPVSAYRNHLLHLLDRHQVVILVGETGCGKSTQVPQYVMEAGWCRDGLVVGVTQPRRVAAVTLAVRVSEEVGCVLGEVVGHSVRFNDVTSDATKIKFMTEGILLREMLADPLLTQYCVIIVDEAHERSVLTDTLLGLLKKILKKRKALRVIVSSATVDAEFLRDYFSDKTVSKADPRKKHVSAAILGVEGRTFGVDIHFVKEPVACYVASVVSTVMALHERESPGDVLAFLPGVEDVYRARDLLQEHQNESGFDKLIIVPLNGSLSHGDQLKAFLQTPRGKRKVVLATNIAETSVTIPGVVYVIDSGYMKMRVYNAESRTDALVTVPVSKANARQRAGRAGRLRPGKVYRLYTQDAWAGLQDHAPPEMQRADLGPAVMQLKALGVDNVLRFNFPSPPPAKNLLAALETLYAIGALQDDGELTEEVGYKLAEMSIGPMLGKALLQSDVMGCSDEVLTVLSMLQVQSVFVKPLGGQQAIRARIAKREFEVAEGDLITLLNVYLAFVESGRTKEFCNKYFLNYRSLKRAHEIKTQLTKYVTRKFNIKIVSCQGRTDIVCRCMAAGLFPNAAYLHYSGCYRSVRGGSDSAELYIHPESALFSAPQPQWVLFCELLNTTKTFMIDVTAISKDWLVELAPHYYHEV